MPWSVLTKQRERMLKHSSLREIRRRISEVSLQSSRRNGNNASLLVVREEKIFLHSLSPTDNEQNRLSVYPSDKRLCWFFVCNLSIWLKSYISMKVTEGLFRPALVFDFRIPLRRSLSWKQGYLLWNIHRKRWQDRLLIMYTATECWIWKKKREVQHPVVFVRSRDRQKRAIEEPQLAVPWNAHPYVQAWSMQWS